MTRTVNIVLPTIRFLPVSKDIMTHLFRAAEANHDLHVTIADGQEHEEKTAWILRMADWLQEAGRFTYIGLKDPTERIYRSAQVETEWILPMADDDPYSVNYLRCACDAARVADPDVTALVPSTYLSYSAVKVCSYRLQPINEPDQLGRLMSLFKQGQNGLLTFGIMRRRLFQDWMEFVRTKSLWPSYSDQLLVSLLAMKGRLVPIHEECAILKDEGDWHDPQRAIIKDARSYRETFSALFHEVFWTADLFSLLQTHGLEEGAVPAVMFRVDTLLRNGVGNFRPRLAVLNIERTAHVQEAAELLMELAGQASMLLTKAPSDQIRFLEHMQAVSRSVLDGFRPERHRPSTEERPRESRVEVEPKTTFTLAESAPAVSVIVPCYGQASFLAEAVESVVAQTYDDWECIIVDDGSPDDVARVAQDLIARHPAQRIRLIRKPNGGLADARNAGIREALGRYILPLDADDRLDPRYLEETVPVLENNPDIAIVYVDERNFGETDHVHRKGVSNLRNLLVGNVHDYCTLYRRSVWEQVGGYSPAMYLGAEDWCFWISAAKRGLRSYHVEQPLFLYRNRPGTMVAQVHSNMEIVKAQIVFHHPDLFTDDGLGRARAILSKVNDQVRGQLEKAYAVHSDNALLQAFHSLAQSRKDDAPSGSAAEAGPGIPSPSEKVMAENTEDELSARKPRDGFAKVCMPDNRSDESSEFANSEEARGVKLASFLEHILRQARRDDAGRTLRMIDVGCGRGWLSNLAAMYGACEGIDPDPNAIDEARRTFPHLRFESCTVEQVLAREEFAPYDVVLCSQVIEHVPHERKGDFLAQVAKLLKPDGYLLLTASRGEAWAQWKDLGAPASATESWVTETELGELLAAQGFRTLGVERVYIDMPQRRYIPAPTPADLRSRNLIPIGQVWACEPGEVARTSAFPKQPMVSVIVPTCDRPERLRGALASILAQSYRDFEIIVVNDGIADVDSVISALNTDGRIVSIKHDRNRGLAAARNTGIRMARGKYIAYLDDDDRYLPDHLETLVTTLEGGPYKAAYSDAWRVHETSEQGAYREVSRDVPYSHDFSAANLLVGNYFPVLCVMHERSCLDEVGLFDESLFAHEDWDLWIRMATRFPFVHVKKTTAEFTWRTDGSSMTSSAQQVFYRTTEVIYRKYKPHAVRLPGVRAAQDRQLAALRNRSSSAAFECSIIIPVWNKVELTRQCVEAIASATTGVTFELIVVDNGSTDGTQEFLKSLAGDVRTIRNRENLGFAKACNQGARAARGKYLVFLNNETIPKDGWLRALVNEVKENPEVGIVGSKLLYPDGTIQHAGVIRDCQQLLPYHIYKSFPGDHPAVNQRREFQIVTAACLLIRRSVFEEVSGFDEGYVNGFEDADLCLKVRERGYLVVYQPRSVVIHLGGQTPGRTLHDDPNAARFLGRWGAQWWAGDEDRHVHADGYKLKRILRNGLLGADIQLFDDIKDRAAWAHVAATQAAALKKDWSVVRRELSFTQDWPRDPRILFWAAQVSEKLGETALQQSYLTRFLELQESPVVRRSLARALLSQKNLVEAEQHLHALLSTSPGDPEGLLLRGVLCMQREQYREAETAFSVALQYGADRKTCLMGMGMAAMGRAYVQGAWERFLQVLREHPDDAEAIHWLLRAGTAQNRWEDLSEHLRAYVARNPGDLAVRLALAGVLLREDSIDAARKERDVLRMLDPDCDGLAELEQAISRKEAILAIGPAEG